MRVTLEYDGRTRSTLVDGRPCPEPEGFPAVMATAAFYAWMGYDVVVRSRGLATVAR